MPELPDVALYLHALEPRVVGQPIEALRLRGFTLLRSVTPPLAACEGKHVQALSRLGKRIVFELEDELFLVFHLMIAGRFQWKPRGAGLGKIVHLALDFPAGTLLLTEAGTQKRAHLHVVAGREGLAAHDPGGLDVLALDMPEFFERDGLYVTPESEDWPDNPFRFASLAWVAARIARDGLADASHMDAEL